MIEAPPPLWLPPRPAIIRAWKKEDVALASLMLPAMSYARVPGKPSRSWISQGNQTGAATTHTFVAQNIGDLVAGEIVIVAASCFSSASGTLSSATIDGVTCAMTQVTGTNIIAALVYARVGTSGTANVVLNWSSSNQNVIISVYRAKDLTSLTPFATATDNAGSSGALAANVNIPRDGIAIAVMVTIDGSAWSGYSSGFAEDSDQFVASSNAGASASGEFSAPETPHAFAATCGTGARSAGVVASWN